MMYSDSTLSVKDATGRHISILNDNQQQHQQHQQKKQEQPAPTPSFNGKRKYHCTEPDCNKSFTTSGHLARHHRIHSGEKNFHCLYYPACKSRFSRQDNMMQHYRTHLSPKSRRHHQQQHQQKSKSSSNKDHHPRLHSHTLVGSESETAIYPLIDTKKINRMMDDPYASAATVTRSRRASTMPSTFHPYQQSSSAAPIPSQTRIRNRHHYQHNQHQHQHHNATAAHAFSVPRPLIQPLSTLMKPLALEPESASSPTLSADLYPQSYQSSRRPQRAHSASSTSSSSSFLSPCSPSLSPPPPPPLINQADIIYPKNFIQLPPLQQETPINTGGLHYREGVSDLIHTVSMFV